MLPKTMNSSNNNTKTNTDLIKSQNNNFSNEDLINTTLSTLGLDITNQLNNVNNLSKEEIMIKDVEIHTNYTNKIIGNKGLN